MALWPSGTSWRLPWGLQCLLAIVKKKRKKKKKKKKRKGEMKFHSLTYFIDNREISFIKV